MSIRTVVFLGFELDIETTELQVGNYIGQYRMYFRNRCWFGKWLEGYESIEQQDIDGAMKIINWIIQEFPKGCNCYMKEYLFKYPDCGNPYRHLLKPILSEHYKVLFDTTYGNEDYPVRIYVYK